jgi:hypothetical protein
MASSYVRIVRKAGNNGIAAATLCSNPDCDGDYQYIVQAIIRGAIRKVTVKTPKEIPTAVEKMIQKWHRPESSDDPALLMEDARFVSECFISGW